MIERDGDRVRLTLSSLEAGAMFGLLAVEHAKALCPVLSSLAMADLANGADPTTAELINFAANSVQAHSDPVPDTMRMGDGVTFELDTFSHFILCQQVEVRALGQSMPIEVVEIFNQLIDSAYLWTDDEILAAIGPFEPEIEARNRAILTAGRQRMTRGEA